MKKQPFNIPCIQWTVYCIVMIYGWCGINLHSFAYSEESHSYDFNFKKAFSEWEQKKESLYKGGSVVYHYAETRDSSTPNMDNTDVYELKILGENSLCNNNQLRMVVRNVKYAFTLERESENDLWTLNNLTYDTAVPLDGQLNLLPETEPIFEGLTVEGIWLSDLLSEDKTKILNCSFDQNGRIALEFEADYSLDITAKIVRGTLFFLPDNHYTMVQYELDMIETPPKEVVENTPKMIKSHTIKKMEYKEINGVLLPQIVQRIYNPEAFFQPRTLITQYDQLSITVDKEIFYLKHYGLSEPDLPKPIGHTTRYTVLCLGIILIVLGIYLRRRASQA